MDIFVREHDAARCVKSCCRQYIWASTRKTNVSISTTPPVTPYLAARATDRLFSKRQEWLDNRCHELKHDKGAAKKILEEMQALPTEGLLETVREGLQEAITYFSNHHQQMKYAERRAEKLPIGSGVTEAACKTLVKMRLRQDAAPSGRNRGPRAVLSRVQLGLPANAGSSSGPRLIAMAFPSRRLLDSQETTNVDFTLFSGHTPKEGIRPCQRTEQRKWLQSSSPHGTPYSHLGQEDGRKNFLSKPSVSECSWADEIAWSRSSTVLPDPRTAS